MPLKTLLVGAGAVGTSYGYHLARGGAEVTFFVKPHHAEALRGGATVYFPKKRGVREPIEFAALTEPQGVGFRVATSLDEVRATAWDAVFLCMSATALRGDWLAPFLAALGPTTTLVMLTPGAEDFAFLSDHFPPERIVGGLITLVAWQSPLPGEAPHPPGIAVWFPPLTKLPFFGAPTLTGPIVAALEAGGAPAKHAGDHILPGGTVASGILTTHIAALEGAGWTFAGLSKSPLKKLAARAAREAVAVLAAHQGKRPPMSRTFIRPWLMGAGLRLAAWRMPFDFEVYLRYHFTKVRDQTTFALGELVRIGREKGLPVEAIEELRGAVFGAD